MTSVDEPARTTSFALLRSAYDATTVRRWALERGIEVSTTGGLPRYLYELYARDQGE